MPCNWPTSIAEKPKSSSHGFTAQKAHDHKWEWAGFTKLNLFTTSPVIINALQILFLSLYGLPPTVVSWSHLRVLDSNNVFGKFFFIKLDFISN